MGRYTRFSLRAARMAATYCRARWVIACESPASMAFLPTRSRDLHGEFGHGDAAFRRRYGKDNIVRGLRLDHRDYAGLRQLRQYALLAHGSPLSFGGGWCSAAFGSPAVLGARRSAAFLENTER